MWILFKVVLFPLVDMVLDVVDSEDRLIFLVEYICICLCGVN